MDLRRYQSIIETWFGRLLSSGLKAAVENKTTAQAAAGHVTFRMWGGTKRAGARRVVVHSVIANGIVNGQPLEYHRQCKQEALCCWPTPTDSLGR